MKIKVYILMLCGLMFVGGCSKQEESKQIDVELSSLPENVESFVEEVKTEVESDEYIEESTSEISDEMTSEAEQSENSVLAKSFAKDSEVKAAQERYMKTLHSEKGKTIMVRTEGEWGVDYIETVKTDKEDVVDLYYYSFNNSKNMYERVLKSYNQDDSITILETDESALFIKAKRNEGMASYFEVAESSAMKGSIYETYVE